MANNQPERIEDKQASKGGAGINAGDEHIFSAENMKYFKAASKGGLQAWAEQDHPYLKGAALGGVYQSAEKHHSQNNFDWYGYMSGIGTTYAFALGREGLKGTGLRPSSLLLGLGVAGADSLVDHTLFKGVDRKAPSMIADGVSMALAFTPQPTYLKAAEMIGLHTAGRFIDKLLD
jgi:hypothetical protein